jgi:hypothetical protein
MIFAVLKGLVELSAHTYSENSGCLYRLVDFGRILCKEVNITGVLGKSNF